MRHPEASAEADDTCLDDHHDGGLGGCVPADECEDGYELAEDDTCIASVLFGFDTHTFSPCGQTGTTGPSLNQCTGAYEEADWVGDVENFDVAGGIQKFTVPEDGVYRIEAWGAQGGGNGGRGAYMAGDFDLVQGEVLEILVGQQGGDAPEEVGNGGHQVCRTKIESDHKECVVHLRERVQACVPIRPSCHK